MKDWVPNLSESEAPRYLALVQALEDDVASGRVKAGTRLLPHREMASRMGVSVGTVSKAYGEAERRGLISGEVGRGTFVCRRSLRRRSHHGGKGAAINLALNIPPHTGEDEIVASVLAEIVAEGELADLLGYLPHQGLRRHRESMVAWLASLGVEADVDHLFITHGGQHALSLALNMVASAGDTVLTESFTYSGILALSSQIGYRLHAVATDEHGLIPEAVERAFSETRARVLYCMPTLQTPTGSVMPPERRKEIAAIVSKHDAYLIEDDAYAFLVKPPPAPISGLIPERSFYVLSFAKCLAPGLRIAAMIVPEAFRDRSNNAVRATGWMAVPAMAEVVARLIDSGDLARQAELKREKAELRLEIARRILKGWLPESPGPAAFHIWLRLPPGRTLTGLIADAAQAGITLAPPEGPSRMDRQDLGVRLCLGGADAEAELETALGEIRKILESAETNSLV